MTSRPRHRARRRPLLVIALASLLIIVSTTGFSLGRALAAPGDLPVSVRLVGWMRDHGGGPLVDVAEAWWYRHHPPATAVDPATVPTRTPAAPGAPGRHPAPLPAAPYGIPVPGENQWIPAERRIGGAAPLYTTFFRPLPESPGVIVGLAWLNQSLVRTQLIAGLRDPRPAPEVVPAVDGNGAQVPAGARDTLLATFNSGFQLRDAAGGFFAAGHEIAPLRDGAASLTITADGRVDVGQWGRDLRLAADTVAVRQNLALVVERGRPVPGVADNVTGAWGTTNNQFQYTWRSGLGITRGGDLVYLAADHITLADLADAMTAAGVVRGMELDMHPQLVTFLSYRPGQAARGTGTKLLPAMVPPATRYLRPSERDFLAVSVRGAG